MALAATVFLLSLLGLALLFTLKAMEAKRGRVFAPRLRAAGDDLALAIKDLMIRGRVLLARVPPSLVLLSRAALHELALGAAKLARLTEAQSHKIADLVSHKRSFEKRSGAAGEPRSEFLKQMGEGKNGGAKDENSEV